MTYLDIIVIDYLASEPELVKEYHEGRTALLGRFVGEITKKTKSKYDAKLTIDTIKK